LAGQRMTRTPMRAGSVPVISETRSRTVPQVLSPPAPDGRVFTGIHGGELASITYRRAWDKARSTALPPAEYASPLARRVYDLRHACVSTWLNGGVPPAQAAEWAGHSVAVLLRVYAKCIDGQDQIAKRRIEDALRETGDE
jgi:integrase